MYNSICVGKGGEIKTRLIYLVDGMPSQEDLVYVPETGTNAPIVGCM